jgi:predicted Fe-Mo cluster-binding NifX family protein
MRRVAIPTFQNRVSPVIDSCTHVLIVDIDQSADVKRENVYLGGMSLAERCRIFKAMGVGTVICGGISATFAQMLTSSDIGFVNGIAGDIDAVLAAFIKDQLDDPSFYMPGYKETAP